MQLQDTAAYRQAQAASLFLRAGRGKPHEALEDFLALLRGKARPLVLDADAPGAIQQRRMQRDLSAVRRCANRIGEQVQEHLSDALFLESHGTVAFVLIREAQPMVFDEHLGVLSEGLKEPSRSLLLQLYGNRLGVGPRQKQELVQDAVDPGELFEDVLHRLLLTRFEGAVDEQPLCVQAHKGERGLQLVGGVAGELAYLRK